VGGRTCRRATAPTIARCIRCDIVRRTATQRDRIREGHPFPAYSLNWKIVESNRSLANVRFDYTAMLMGAARLAGIHLHHQLRRAVRAGLSKISSGQWKPKCVRMEPVSSPQNVSGSVSDAWLS
jgi:hypothetical protein